jgi:hypothetical protein
MKTTVDLIKIADRIADLGRILVHEYSQDACDVQDGIEDGFILLEKELGLV